MIGKMKSNISIKDTLAYNIKEASEVISINNLKERAGRILKNK